MAAIILIFAGVVVWLEVAAAKHIGRASLREAQAAYVAAPGATTEDQLAHTAGQIAVLLDLRACWFEPFPFDELLPRIEHGRITLPMPEPGVAPCSNFGVELPVRMNGLTLGRFVLVPPKPSVGVVFSPTARDQALALAERLGPPLAVALRSYRGWTMWRPRKSARRRPTNVRGRSTPGSRARTRARRRRRSRARPRTRRGAPRPHAASHPSARRAVVRPRRRWCAPTVCWTRS